MMIWLKSTQKNVVWRLKLTYLDVLLQGRTMFEKSLKNWALNSCAKNDKNKQNSEIDL